MSSVPIITTKFRLFQPPAWSVTRKLVDKIGLPESSVRCTLINAPAGYGKTTLLAQWAAQSDTQTVWLSLDASENASHRLLVYLVAAFECSGVIKKPAGQYPGLASPEPADKLWARLLNGIGDFGAPICLILDSTECLKNVQAWAVVERLLQSCPTNLSVMLAGRRSPALNLSRLRAAGQLQEYGPTELSFDVEEHERLLTNRGYSAAASDVYRLHALTEGWPIGGGLLVAALERQGAELFDSVSIQRAHDLAMLWVRDYLTAEVIQPLPQNLQDFVLKTCHVNAFTEQLAEELASETLSRKAIDALEQRYGLLSKTAEDGWFCYHPMFRAGFYLLACDQWGSLIEQQHARAALWLLEAKRFGEGLHQYARCHSLPELLKLIEKHAFDLLREGEVNDIADTLLKIPGVVAQDHYVLAMIEASVVHVSKNVSRIKACIKRLEKLSGHLPDSGNPIRLKQTLAYLHSQLHYLGGNLRHSVRVCSETLDDDASADSPNAATAVLRFHRATGYFALGYIDRAYADAQQSYDELNHLGLSGYTNTLSLLLGQIELSRGQLELAEQRFQELFASISGTVSGTRNFYDVYGVTGLGLVRCQQNRFGEAVALLTDAANIAHRFKPSAALPWVFHHLAMTAWAQGNKDRAAGLFKDSQNLAKRNELYVIYRLSGAYRVRLLMTLEGESDDYVQEWFDEWARATHHYGLDIMPEERLAAAWYQYYAGELGASGQQCDGLEDFFRRNGQMDLLLDCILLRANLARQAEDLPGALGHVHMAISVARQHRLHSLFFREGRELIDLFQLGMSRKALPQHRLDLSLIEVEWLEDMLASQVVANSSNEALPDLLPFEALTKRERDVLVRIAEGMGNQQIADSLFVSVSTVKTHVNSIFRKLEVATREAACARAAQYRLLD